MESTLNGAAAAPSSDQSAVQNAKGGTSTVKLVLLWLAVGLPMLWGILKAFEDVHTLIP